MWQVIAPLLPARDPARGGRPQRYSHRLVIDTILYVLVSGCAWRLTPHNLAPWHTAYRRFRHWSRQGVWDHIHTQLRDLVRQADGRDPAPSAAIIDSQSILSACGGQDIGWDQAKKTRGRKRHLLVDTLGLVLVCHVHSAAVNDRTGARLVLGWLDEQHPSIGLIWLDGGYANIVDDSLIGWAEQHLGITLQVVKRGDDPHTFTVLPRRWTVERTFAWISRCRRLARDYERLTAHAEDFIHLAMIKLMAARLAGQSVAYQRLRRPATTT